MNWVLQSYINFAMIGLTDDPLGAYDWNPDIDRERRDHLVGRMTDVSILTQEEALIVQLGLVSKAFEIVLAKRHDYSGADDPFRNLRDAASFWGVEPFKGAGIRMMDKFSRTRSIIEMGKQNVEDKLIDDWADAHNYTDIIAGLCIEGMPDREAMLTALEDQARRLPENIERLLEASGIITGDGSG